MRKYRLSMAAAVMAFVLSGCGMTTGETFALSNEADDTLIEEQAEENVSRPVLYVDICGAVTKPGVYELAEGSRVMDAVAAAEGLLPEADRRRINQARYLTDGEKIIVFAVGEEAALNDGEETDRLTPGDGTGININTAGTTELQSLKGIGEAKAQAIVEDREKNGAFRSAEDIMRVTGIGEGLFDRIREDITV